MKSHLKKVLRFDVSDSLTSGSLVDLLEFVTLGYEIIPDDRYSDKKSFNLVWKIHYTNEQRQELIGLLILHQHDVNLEGLLIMHIKRALLSSALEAKEILEKKFTKAFMDISEFDFLNYTDIAIKIYLNLNRDEYIDD
jgi:hypothetical protein